MPTDAITHTYATTLNGKRARLTRASTWSSISEQRGLSPWDKDYARKSQVPVGAVGTIYLWKHERWSNYYAAIKFDEHPDAEGHACLIAGDWTKYLEIIKEEETQCTPD